jgi:hypothetical protein
VIFIDENDQGASVRLCSGEANHTLREPPATSSAVTRCRRLRDRLGGFDEHDLGEARQGLEFSVERDAADAIDAVDVPRQTMRKTSFGRPCE